MFVLGTAALSAGAAAEAIFARKSGAPNFILILTDDQGYGDLGCYGATDLRTPNLDALAAGGIRMTSFYSPSPVCSPARAGLLTGRYPDRTGILGVLRKHHDQTGMDLGEVTLAEVLARHGYVTGLCGKWHLGVGPKYRPRARGFQETFGLLNGMMDYYTHIGGGGMDGQPSLFRNDQPVDEKGYFTDLVNREALAFLERHHERPFFLFLSYTAPHLPLQAPEEIVEQFSELRQKNPQRAVYAAMLYCADAGIGRIRERLRTLGIADRTVIIFLSDQGWVQDRAHGAASNNGGLSSRGLTGGKYYLAEGGIRVPCIFFIPGCQPAVNDTLAINLDVFPTILSLAGCKTPAARPLDGIDLLPNLADPTRQLERTLFWRFRDDQIGTGEQWAARRGPWKVIHLDGRTRLFNLREDEAETEDLASQHPALVAELQAQYQRWLRTLPAISWKSKADGR